MDSDSYKLFDQLGKNYEEDIPFESPYNILNQLPMSFAQQSSPSSPLP